MCIFVDFFCDYTSANEVHGEHMLTLHHLYTCSIFGGLCDFVTIFTEDIL